MSPQSLAVTGATGHLGGLVSRLLDSAGAPHRLIVRDPSSPRVPGHATVTGVTAAEYGDLDAATHALVGTTVLFMVSASESADRLAQHRTFVDAAAAAGVEHVVYTSFLGAAPRRDLHPRARPLRHRAAPQGLRDGLDVPARQLLPRLHRGARRC